MSKVKRFFYSQKAAPYVFILPFVITIILFWIAPIANGVLLSFQDVLKDEYFACHPCINTSSLKIRTEDLTEKIIPAMGHEPQIVRL